MEELKTAVRLLQAKTFKTQDDMVACLRRQFPNKSRDELRLMSKEAVAAIGLVMMHAQRI